ncbi:hypothetical protein BZARG_1063 [Bizionia argentinensis JUB59]|uniref:Lipoprotein n=1 Tax=Bizionia argentinensis JUB59 TaxID=1046627 RepID=G2EEG2_9FLAO|nr:hypothetical protein [Bizionia argentinensis]EGV43187.1 hypothetical protein BZARG_1063 [Bizionia argentinensis JUB59]
MKIIILSGICMLILLLVTTGCARLAGGVSKKKAASNLEAYLQREYKGKLTFSDLNRFFNAATMNPNMFTVLIYDKQIPEVEFYTRIDVKKILINDTLYTTENLTFNDLYKEAVKRYETKQAIRADFKNEIPEIDFTLGTIYLNFNDDLSPENLENVITRFIDRLNQSFEELNDAYKFNILIKTPDYPEGFIDVPLEVDDNKWHAEPFMLSENFGGFEALKTKIEIRLQAKLDSSYPHFKINMYKKVYLDKSSLSKGAWVQYLDDKRVVNNDKGKYVNPQKGIYVTYFDLESEFIYRGEMLTEENDKTSYETELRRIIEAIEEEGIRAN